MVRLSLENLRPCGPCATVGKVSETLSTALRAAPLVFALYFFGLTNMGLISADEPRYAAVSLEMARSGDWVTPKLWGERWFEKPPLLYWMEAAGFRFGLGQELAPRLPGALIGIAFLAFYYWALAREFSQQGAMFSTAMLGTSAGWLAFSHIAVTDLPMSAAFAAAMLLCLRAWEREDPLLPLGTAIAAGALLGVAVLAKGLVPLVLALPLVRMARRDPRSSAVILVSCLVVAAPWYALCTARNGSAFLDDFIWKHHFQRFASDALAHRQPVWFYLPVLLAGIFPWTPALMALFRKSAWHDPRRQFLLAWVVWGLAFFSASLNKLPGYLLPLLPALFALAGVALAESTTRAKWILGACGVLLAAVPVAGFVLPQALATGLSRAGWPKVPPVLFVPALLLAALSFWFEARGARTAAVAAVAFGMALGVVWITAKVYPVIDLSLSARAITRPMRGHEDDACVVTLNRSQEYGLDYYLGRKAPRCADSPRVLRVSDQGGRFAVTVGR